MDKLNNRSDSDKARDERLLEMASRKIGNPILSAMNKLETKQNNPKVLVPGSWYELIARVDSALAVANCILDSAYFVKDNEKQYEMQNHTCNLAAALISLLELCNKDANKLEKEILALA